MAWIELHQSVWSHRKTLLLADLLSLPPVYAAAHMAQLWTWGLDNTPAGDLTGLSARVIATGAGWPGEPEAFVSAAVTAGYLDRADGCLYIHNWAEYAGRLLDRRQQQRDRMRQVRAKPVTPPALPPVGGLPAPMAESEPVEIGVPSPAAAGVPSPQPDQAPAERPVNLRETPEYREFEAACRDGHLDSWLTFTAFEQLHRTATSVDGRCWDVLIEVAKEAALSATGRPPSTVYGVKMLTNLPLEVKTRDQARERFEARRRGNGPARSQGPSPPPPAIQQQEPEEDGRERIRRLRAQAQALAARAAPPQGDGDAHPTG